MFVQQDAGRWLDKGVYLQVSSVDINTVRTLGSSHAAFRCDTWVADGAGRFSEADRGEGGRSIGKM